MPNDYGLDKLSTDELLGVSKTPAAPSAPPTPSSAPVTDYGLDKLPANELLGTPSDLAAESAKAAALFEASFGNPTEEVKRRNLSAAIQRMSGEYVPPSVMDTADAQRKADRLSADHATRASPRTSAFLSVPENAAVAMQDAKTLAQIEAIVGGDPLRSAEIALKRLAMSSANLGAWGFDVAGVAPDIAGEGLAAVGLPNEYNVFRDMASGSRRHATAARAAVDYFTPEARNMVERAAASAGTSAGTSLQLLPLAMSGAGAPMAAAFGLGTFGESYTKARDQGKNPIQALQYAIPQGAYEALFEMAPAAFLADALKTAPGLKQFVAGLAAREVPTEMATTVAQNLNDWVTFNPNKSVADFIAEQPEALAETIIATVMGAGVQAGIIHGAQRTTGQFQQMQEERRAKQLQETLTGLMDQAKNVKSDPVTFQNFMVGVTDNATVFINADALQDTLAQNKMDVSVLPSLAEQLAQPSVTGDVEVPIGELMTAFAGTPAQEQVVQHARVRQDDLSAAEQAQFGDMAAFFKKQGAAVMEKQKANEAFVSERQEIEADIVKQLGAASPFQEREHKYYAQMMGAFYSTAADLMGTTPKQIQARWAPKILGATDTAPSADNLSQGFDHGNAMLNVGLDVGATDRAQKIDADFVKAEIEKMGVQVLSAEQVEGEYEYEGKPVKELTYVPHLSRPLTEAEVNQLAIATGQEAIGQYDNGTGNLWGPNAAAWGDFNPEFFKDQHGTKLSDAQKALEQPSQKYKAVDVWSKTFQAWFGRSKVVDDRGRPLRVFHGTASDVGAFDPSKAGANYPTTGGREGLYFTDDSVIANVYAEQAGYKEDGGENVVPVYLSLQNPVERKTGGSPDKYFDYNRDKILAAAKKAGADGVIVRGGDRTLYVAFKSEQVKSAISNTGRFQGPNVLEQSQSARRPTAKRAPEDHLGEVPLSVDYTKIEPEKTEQNMKLVSQYPGIRFKARKAEGRAEEFIQHVTNNLLWLHDQIPAEIRQRSKLWYDGARAITDRWSAKYGKTDAQIAAILAVYSPQKDWFVNVSLAERTLDIVANQQDTAWSPEMTEVADKILADEKFSMLRGTIEGKKLSELKDRLEQAAWLRTFDEAHNNRGHRLVTPEGGFIEFATSVKGAEKKTGWPGFGTIIKALYVIDDGSPKMIDNALGGEHKVRSFYNNIFHPTSDVGFVTIDTHAVAAGLLRPLSGNSVEVSHNFGGAGTATSAATGMSGTYAYYQEAYRRAAEARGLLPREMQSITWEAVRELYTGPFKRDAAKMAVVDKLWSEYEKGKRDLDSVRAGILNLAGGVEQPSWVNRDSGISPEGWASTYTGELLGDSVPRRDTGGVDAGARERAAAGISGSELAQLNRSAGAVAGPVVGIHFSKAPRTSLSSGMFGTGMPGAERDRVMASNDPRIKQRVAFYVNTGNGIKPEDGVGSHAHTATLRNLYDADADALKIWKNAKDDMNQAESAVLDAGFDGYLTRGFGKQGAVVMLGKRSIDAATVKKEDVDTVAEQPPSPEIPKMKQAAMAIMQNRALPNGRQSVESWRRDLERSDPDTAALIAWDKIPAGDYYKDQIAGQLWQTKWFYSALQRAIESAPAKVFSTGKATAQWLSANAGKMAVKKEEIEATGITDWLETQGKVTKEQVVEFLKAGGVKVEEVVLGKGVGGSVVEIGGGWEARSPSGSRLGFAKTKEAAEVIVSEAVQTGKFASYQLPGGENYREWLLALPSAPADYEYQVYGAFPQGPFKTEESAQAYVDRLTTLGADEPGIIDSIKKFPFRIEKVQTYESRKQGFRSSHFDQPNILAHIRTNERTDADGKRVLFIEEIQSDWAQKGRKNGFNVPVTGYQVFVDGVAAGAPYESKIDAYDHKTRALKHNAPDKVEIREVQALQSAQSAGNKGLVPLAPFVTDTKSWTALALKRMIAHAVENGFDSVAWTTGEQQAARYDLSKQVSKIEALNTSDGKTSFVAYGLDGEQLAGETVPTRDLPDHVGKDLAEKISKQPAGHHEYEGLDLKVGGEGMKGYYDGIVPQVANDVLKKLGGGKVQQMNFYQKAGADYVMRNVKTGKLIENTRFTKEEADAADPAYYTAEYSPREMDTEVEPGEFGIQPGFQITPAMREAVGQGLPLFAEAAGPRRGSFNPLTFDLRLLADANRSTFIHEASHFFMAAYIDMASQPDAPPALKQYVEDLLGYLFKNVPGGEQVGGEGLGQKVGAGGTALLAPNGKPSKLNAQQWKQVRTTEFKAWFGDWEKHARAKNPVGSLWSDDSVSKIVDENGEPMVVYHGTQQGGFDIFRPEKGDKHRSPMLFATDDPGTARSYSGRPGEIEVQDQQALDRWEELRSQAAYDEKKLTKAERAELRKLDDLFNHENGGEMESQRGIYHLFLNIRNPNEADFEGANWDGQAGYDDWQVINADQEIVYQPDGRGTLREQEARDYLASLGGEEAGYAVVKADDRFETTNSVAEEALRFKQDGAIIRNVTDDGGKHGYGVDPSDVFVFFDSNQVKSATQNTGAFSTQNDSILHQDGQPATPGAIPEGRTNIERWNAMTLDQQRAYWEFFAEGWEQYAMSGKAPTKALQSAFSAFAKWMKEIYKTLKNFVTMHGTKPLDAELTQYFDRMLATDEELEAARAERGFQTLFKNLAESGMSPGQFADYMALDALQKTEAEELLRSRSIRDMKWLSNAKSKAIKEIQAEADELRNLVRAGVEEELANTPIRQAERWLRKGLMVQDGEQIVATAGFKLDSDIVKTLFPQGAIDSVDLSRLKQMMASTGTQHPDDVAKLFDGFRNGEHLVRELLNLQPFKDEAAYLTDLRMLEEHGDLATPEAIEKAADEAIHNDAHLKMVATEVWALTNRTGSVAALTKAAKAFASNLVDNTVVKKLSPVQFVNAATRAGKAAVRAMAKKDTDKAASEKRVEMVNAAAAKEAYAAEAEVRAIMTRLRKIAAYSDKHSSITSREFGVVQAVRAILAEFEIGTHGEKATKYLKTLSDYDPTLGAVLDDVIEQLAPESKPWPELKVADLRELHAAVTGLWRVAKEVRSVELAGEKMSLDDARAQLIAKLEETGAKDRQSKAFSLTDAEIRNQDFQSYAAKAIRPENWVSMKDGLDEYGPWRRLIWNTIDRAQLDYNADKGEKLKQLKALLVPIMADMTDIQIDAPELGGSFGAGSVIGYSELLHAVLHTGNTSNKTKLLVGRGWGSLREDGSVDSTKWDTFMKRMWAEGKITKTHMDFVQGVWDLLESMKEGAQKAHRATTGRYFEEIEAAEIVTPFGVYRGGYAPAIVDRRQVADMDIRKLQEAAEMDVVHSFDKPASGFTKSRVQNYNQKLELNIAALGRHVDQVLLFSHMSGPVRNVQRVLKGKDLSNALAEADRAAMAHVLAPWLHSAATQVVTEKGKLSYENMTLFTKLRSRAGMALMFANVSNSLQQLTSFFPAMLEVGKKDLLFAAAKGWYKPREMAASIAAMSPYMKQRLDNEVHAMAEEIDQILLNPTKFEKAQDWAVAHSYFLQMAVDTVMSPIIWQAKFNEATARGAEKQEAIDLADSAVRKSQGSNRAIDIAAMEKGSPFYRMFMQFAGFFNSQINLIGEKLARERLLPKTPAKYGRIAMILAQGWWAPAITSMAIALAMRGGPDDEDGDGLWDDWLTELLLGTVRYATASIPVFGQAINATVNAFNDKPYDDRMSLSPAVSLIDASIRGGQAAVKSLDDPTKAGRAVRDLGSFLSLFGVPVTPITKAVGYATDVETGKVDPTSGADYARGIVTGVASPESK